MLTSSSCSWCHHFNTADRLHCEECGHEAHKARMDCRCSQCVRPAFPFEEAFRKIYEEDVVRGLIEPQEQAMYQPAYKVGERVIFCTHFADLDGLRGVVETAYPGGYYDVRFDDDSRRDKVWESKLLREADHPDYP